MRSQDYQVLINNFISMAKQKDVNATGVDTVERAKIEAERGIVRNENGEIVWTPAQAKEKIAYFEAKLEDNLNRAKNIKARIKELQKFL
jgi:hypothetical protein